MRGASDFFYHSFQEEECARAARAIEVKRARRKGLNREMALGISLEKGPGGPRCVQHEQTLLKCSHVSRSSKSQCCVPERSELGATFRKFLNAGEAQVADSGNFRHSDVFQPLWRCVSYQSAIGPLAHSLSTRQSVGSQRPSGRQSIACGGQSVGSGSPVEQQSAVSDGLSTPKIGWQKALLALAPA